MTTYPSAPNRLTPYLVALDQAAHTAKSQPVRPVINWAQRDAEEQAAKAAIIQPVERPVKQRRPINRGAVEAATIHETAMDRRQGANTDAAEQYLKWRAARNL